MAITNILVAIMLAVASFFGSIGLGDIATMITNKAPLSVTAPKNIVVATPQEATKLLNGDWIPTSRTGTMVLRFEDTPAGDHKVTILGGCANPHAFFDIVGNQMSFTTQSPLTKNGCLAGQNYAEYEMMRLIRSNPRVFVEPGQPAKMWLVSNNQTVEFAGSINHARDAVSMSS